MITLALLHEFVYEFKGNNTYTIKYRTALVLFYLFWLEMVETFYILIKLI